MRYRIIMFSVLICSIIELGCIKNADDGQSKVTITFWHSFVASTIPSLENLIKEFEAEHPTIHIRAQYVPTGDALIQKLVTAVQSQTAPDISWVHADFLDKLVEGNAVYPMSEFIHGENGLAESDLADIFPPLLQAAKCRDTLYALPMEATSLALLYNKALFRKAGLDPEHPPETWEELESFTKMLTVDKDADGTYDQFGFFVPVFPASGDLNIWMILQWTPFLWQAGGREIDSAQRNVLFDTEAGVQALTLWKTMYDAMNFSRFSMAHDMAFANQIVAMVMDGPWNLPRYRQMKNIEWAVAPLPAGTVKRATYIAGEHLTIFKQSKHPKEAWKFIKWMLRPDVQARFSMNSGYLPVRKQTLQLKEYRAFLDKDPSLKAFVDQMQWGEGRASIDHYRVEINRFLAEAIEKATLGKAEPRQALRNAAQKANNLLQTIAHK